MNYNIIVIIICLVLLVSILIWLYLRHRKNKTKKLNIPLELTEALNDFNEAERLLLESRGEKNPQQILWEVYKNKHKGGITNGRTDRGTGDSETQGTTDGIRSEGSPEQSRIIEQRITSETSDDSEQSIEDDRRTKFNRVKFKPIN
jgi:hypothetical protein